VRLLKKLGYNLILSMFYVFKIKFYFKFSSYFDTGNVYISKQAIPYIILLDTIL